MKAVRDGGDHRRWWGRACSGREWRARRGTAVRCFRVGEGRAQGEEWWQLWRGGVRTAATTPVQDDGAAIIRRGVLARRGTPVSAQRFSQPPRRKRRAAAGDRPCGAPPSLRGCAAQGGGRRWRDGDHAGGIARGAATPPRQAADDGCLKWVRAGGGGGEWTDGRNGGRGAAPSPAGRGGSAGEREGGAGGCHQRIARGALRCDCRGGGQAGAAAFALYVDARVPKRLGGGSAAELAERGGRGRRRSHPTRRRNALHSGVFAP